MQDLVEVSGMILKSEPIGEYDRRIVLLTDKRGKISAFARGARKTNSRYVASTNPFVFGNFKLYEGRSSYSLSDVEPVNFFDGFRTDMEAAYYGMYFLEVADYYTRENNDERQMLGLLYQSMKALLHPGIDNRLIRAVFEIKSTVVNGEFPGIAEGSAFLSSTIHAVDHIVSTGVEKLYTFTVSEEVLEQLMEIARNTCRRIINTHFNSLDILEGLQDDRFGEYQK